MKVVRLLISVGVVATFAVACSGLSPSPTIPSSGGSTLDLTASQLPGTWELVSIQPTGDAEQARPSGASYIITFADGRLSTRADCNLCGGTYTLTGQTLMAGPSLACTRAACVTMAFESAYTRLLAGESTVSMTDGTLVLTSPRGVLRFTR